MKMSGEHEYLNGTDPPTTASPRSSTHVAARTSVAWSERANTLTPVLGHFGVTAIYLRALERAETDYPWLHEVREQTQRSHPFAPLVARLSLCTPETAAAVQAFLLEQFDQQLTGLLGKALAERMLALAGARGEVSPSAPRPDEIGEQLTLSALRAEADARLARCERDEAVRASEQDDLTGTANRSRMLDRLNSAIALAERTGTPTAVLFIDLDRFKQVNDGMGHRAGDKLLQEIATRLQAAVRKTDTVCRYGGDEFVVILTPMERRSEAEPAAARLRQAIENARGTDPAVPAISASIGIGLYPEHGTNPDALLSRADRSMYQQKRGRRAPLPATRDDTPGAQSDVASRPGGDAPLAYGPLLSLNQIE